MKEKTMEFGMWELPEGCIAHILSLTSPRDACRCSAVSSKFRQAAESDTVWERFLPCHWKDIISRSVSPAVKFSSKKALFNQLSCSPILLDQGNKSFALDKVSGKICCTLGSKELSTLWDDDPLVLDGTFPMSYLFPFHIPLKSRFLKVSDTNAVSYLRIRARIQSKYLSPNTTYAAYLVYAHRFGGDEYPPMKVLVRLVGEGDEIKVEEVVNDAYLLTTSVLTSKDDGFCGRSRSDGWMEIEVGEFFTREDEVEMEIRLWGPIEYTAFVVSGLIVHGIELRPKD
ncbi:putative F-box protein PP2-B12 [Ziziphus jujuba]|uniref:F-box protein PP2-B12 n=2 Tax=Ziziphus jujuba TaxID=326968 RepID=A0A6P4AGB6_ZIZJJ|nr:putative F-box protein PP2-B12 [Ziziphus jujuba]KAH7521827.1 hypothetical protein FEM48_Zijuj07G0073400 [Ziziphus jujuba var. spinosa]